MGNLDQQLFNKANEIQEEISKKRFELRVAQIRLAGIRARKILYAETEKQPDESLCAVDGVTAGGPSQKETGKIKSKWVNAFKNVKGKQATTVKPATPVATGPPPVLENNHQFQEYTYKNITPCDVCSQVMKGHTRQGLKCKLCRMNVHAECQEKVVKCQPKAKLQRRVGSEMGDDDTGFHSGRASVEPGVPSLRRQNSPLQQSRRGTRPLYAGRWAGPTPATQARVCPGASLLTGTWWTAAAGRSTPPP